jgi:hypothetical protein
MLEKIDKFVKNYISFTFQLPPVGIATPTPVTIMFNSYEIWEVMQNDGIDIEIYTSELGKSSSTPKNNGLSFSFNCNANYSADTRQKVLIMFTYLKQGANVLFTFYNYRSFIPNFPHNIAYTPTALTTQAVILDYVAVQMNSTAIDSTQDTVGVLSGDNSTIAILVKEAVNPLDIAPCKRLSINDFALAPFILDNDAYGYYISIVYVELAVNGLIEYFLNHPVGTLQQTAPFSPATGIFEFNSINPTNNVMIYTDSALSYITFGYTYKVVIPNIKVQLKTGERCEITFEQEYTISV